MRKHYKNKDYFPLKERSPILTLLFALSTYLAIVILILGQTLNISLQAIDGKSTVEKTQIYELGLQSPMFCICEGNGYYYHKNDPDKYKGDKQGECDYYYFLPETTRAENYMEKYETSITINQILLAIYVFMRFFQMISYLFRNWRLIFAFSNQANKPIFRRIFGNEISLIILSSILSLLLTVLGLVTKYQPFTFYIYQYPSNPAQIDTK